MGVALKFPGFNHPILFLGSLTMVHSLSWGLIVRCKRARGVSRFGLNAYKYVQAQIGSNLIEGMGCNYCNGNRWNLVVVQPLWSETKTTSMSLFFH